jgi:membrane protein required for colicin V production
MNFIDYLILIVLLASVVLGFFRGFLREAIGLLSWLGGLWLAWHFAYLLEPHLGGQLAKAPFNTWAARGILMLGCLVIGWLVGNIVSYFMTQSGLSLMLDRLIGVLFGFIRGIVLIAVAVLLAREVDLQESSWWRASYILPHATEVASWVKGFAESGVTESRPTHAHGAES